MSSPLQGLCLKCNMSQGLCSKRGSSGHRKRPLAALRINSTWAESQPQSRQAQLLQARGLHLGTLSPETTWPKGQPSPPGYPSKEAPSRKRNKTKATETTAESKTLQFELEAPISTSRTAFQAETWSQSDSCSSHYWLPRWLGEITLFSLRTVCTEEVIIMELCTG